LLLLLLTVTFCWKALQAQENQRFCVLWLKGLVSDLNSSKATLN
jgi:hypothetical protein